MNKIKLGITGCMGRMGRQLIKSSKKDKSFKLTTLTENIEISKKIEQREVARKNKEFAMSDQIRDELIELGIILEDSINGTSWRRK